MRLFFFVSMIIMGLGSLALADEITQTTNPSGGVTTTVQSPTGTTVINSNPGQSVVTRARDGGRIEMDSDGSVYSVYPDGARVAAPNGVNTLLDGQTITVKDGKRIP